MKHSTLLLLPFLVLLGTARAQSPLTQVIAPAGGFITGSGGSLSFTIGETAVQSLTGTGGMLTQGFQQPLDAGTPLPLDFLSFTATLVEGQTQLLWVTAQEQNTGYFEVQRSTDGSVFSTLFTVQSLDNAAAENTYHAVDPDPSKNTDYYRLKEVDVNGLITYSPIVVIQFGSALTAMVYPNPASSEIVIQLQCPTAKQALIGIYDTRGQLLISKTVQFAAGPNQVVLAIGTLAKGLYFISISGLGGLPPFTIMKQ
jgi:Secretion system C-terminal sorting domain